MNRKEKARRLFIEVSDVMGMLRLGISASYKTIQDMKAFFNKSKHQYIGLRDFSEYTGLALDDIEAYMDAN